LPLKNFIFAAVPKAAVSRMMIIGRMAGRGPWAGLRGADQSVAPFFSGSFLGRAWGGGITLFLIL
jgi:hypothetical protein